MTLRGALIGRALPPRVISSEARNPYDETGTNNIRYVPTMIGPDNLTVNLERRRDFSVAIPWLLRNDTEIEVSRIPQGIRDTVFYLP